MKIFNLEITMSEATRRDWRSWCETSREFVDELWLPVTVVRLAVCASVIAVLVLGSLFGGEGFGTGPEDGGIADCGSRNAECRTARAK